MWLSLSQNPISPKATSPWASGAGHQHIPSPSFQERTAPPVHPPYPVFVESSSRPRQLPTLLLGMPQEMPQEGSGPGASLTNPSMGQELVPWDRECSSSGDTPCPGTRQDGTARATGLAELQAGTLEDAHSQIHQHSQQGHDRGCHMAVPKPCCPHPKGTRCTPGEPPTVSPTSLGLWGLSPGHPAILSSHLLPPSLGGSSSYCSWRQQWLCFFYFFFNIVFFFSLLYFISLRFIKST